LVIPGICSDYPIALLAFGLCWSEFIGGVRVEYIGSVRRGDKDRVRVEYIGSVRRGDKDRVRVEYIGSVRAE
jgi:hypothetical protein